MSKTEEKGDIQVVEVGETTQTADRVTPKPQHLKAKRRVKQRGSPGKKRVTFVDQKHGKRLAEVHVVESFKKYNVLDEKDDNANCSCRLL